jgi:hypothetical protein
MLIIGSTILFQEKSLLAKQTGCMHKDSTSMNALSFLQK